MAEYAISQEKSETMPYYQKFTPKVDWQWMLIIGMVTGAFLSAYLSGTLKVLIVPPLFAASFGTDPNIRSAVALFGGILMGMGARWAGGCTSGHGISRTLQLSLAS